MKYRCPNCNRVTVHAYMFYFVCDAEGTRLVFFHCGACGASLEGAQPVEEEKIDKEPQA